jgi:hypothetical protein
MAAVHQPHGCLWQSWDAFVALLLVRLLLRAPPPT